MRSYWHRVGPLVHNVTGVIKGDHKRKRDTEMHEERMLWMMEAKIEVLQL